MAIGKANFREYSLSVASFWFRTDAFESMVEMILLTLPMVIEYTFTPTIIQNKHSKYSAVVVRLKSPYPTVVTV